MPYYAPAGMTNPMSAQDDLVVGGAAGAAARLAKGADSQVLTVDPTTHHLLWAAPAAGGGSLAFIAEQIKADSTSGLFTFASIATSYRVLKLGLFGASNQAGQVREWVHVRLNGDAGNNYTWVLFQSEKGGSSAADGLGGDTSAVIAALPAATAPANDAGDFELTIAGANSSTFSTPFHSVGTNSWDTSNNNTFVNQAACIWRPGTPAAITQIDLYLPSGHFVAGTVATLWGLKNA